MRYDVCIVGAGPEGLAASILLARSGMKVIVAERATHPGGRCTTREFHPGFRASPFGDELAPIPAPLFWSLGLAQAGALFLPAPASVAVWPDRVDVLGPQECEALDRTTHGMRDAALVHAEAQARTPIPRYLRFLRHRAAQAPWPGAELGDTSLAERFLTTTADPRRQAHLMARALEGRSTDPFLSGSALHLLAPGRGGSGTVAGGLSKLADTLADTARAAGVEIRCGADVVEIRRKRGRVCGVSFADGNDLAARSVISTFDVKRTFLSFFQWNTLPEELTRAVSTFRFCGSTARVLLALNAAPDLSRAGAPEALRAPIHIAPDIQDFAFAHAAWRANTIPKHLPITVRVVSAADPSLAPAGAATMTLTIGSVPNRLFDGAWTHEKRGQLRNHAIARVEQMLPGTLARIQAIQVIVPPDIEEELTVTEGDLWGGEIAADQMFDLRPGLGERSPRTPIKGLYLAGPSTTAGVLGTCASGAMAAYAVQVDMKSGRLS
ncbi:MAG: NAD(P)/FAD-dependent oxidoreductase [Rhizomicrobium sp.]